MTLHLLGSEASPCACCWPWAHHAAHTSKSLCNLRSAPRQQLLKRSFGLGLVDPDKLGNAG